MAKEVEERKLPIKIGLLSPGIMITDFITHSMGNDAFELPEKTKKVYNILLIIGVAISVIIVGVMGIRIITGSAEDKAEIKEQMVPYLIGCGVMFGAFTIWKIAMVIAGAVGIEVISPIPIAPQATFRPGLSITIASISGTS